MNEEAKTEISQKKKINLQSRVILVLVFIFLVAIFMFVNLRGEYLNILQAGENFKEVFSQNIKYEYLVIGINFVFVFLLMYITTKFIKKGLKCFFDEDKIEMPKLPNKSIALIAGAIISIGISPFLQEKTMLLINATQFGGEPDPIFNIDIGFYLFQQPFIEMILYYIIFMFVVLSIYIAIYYIVVFNKYFDGISLDTLKKNTLINQIIFNAIVVAVAIAGLVFMGSYDVVYEKSINIGNDIVLYGGGLTDVTIKVWAYRLFAILIPIAAYIGIRYIKKSQKRKAIIALGTIPAYLVGMFIIMTAFQLIIVSPNELDKEKQYIEYNISSTKKAYNIDIQEFEVNNSGTITSEQIQQNTDIIDNIPIISEEVILKNLEEYQTSTGYYSYRNISIAKYNINGKEQLCYIAPREIISDNGRTYNSKTYEYTHGYGAIITSASDLDDNNNIVYIQKGLEGEEIINVEEPRIYFGLQTNQTIITNVKKVKEFDYPKTSSTNAENVYDGKAGLNLNWLDRLILGIHTGNLKIAFNTNTTPDSKVITNRNIIERAKTLMPYLVYDEEPYLVITDEGKQVWVLDGYTMSNSYPYSQETFVEENNVKTRINYIRNSVKVLIDAYDGTMQFYITDRTDPIIMAYNNIYDGLFMDKDAQIPESIEKHMVYPKLLYNIQAQMLTLYHDVQTEVLYRQDDVWCIAKSTVNKPNSNIGTQMEPYYTMVKTIDSNENELGLVLPYSPNKKQNIIAYLVGTYENDNKLKLYKFNSDSSILGPMQLNNQTEQDEAISEELKSVNVAGSKITKEIIIVPIDNTLLYVEPIYQVLLNETQIQVPVLKKIVVASGNKIAIGDNLNEAISRLVSQEASRIEIENTEDEEGLIEAIIKANNNLEESSKNNNWELMGKDITKLQELIKQLELIQKEKEQAKENEVEGNDEEAEIENKVRSIENVI